MIEYDPVAPVRAKGNRGHCRQEIPGPDLGGILFKKGPDFDFSAGQGELFQALRGGVADELHDFSVLLPGDGFPTVHAGEQRGGKVGGQVAGVDREEMHGAGILGFEADESDLVSLPLENFTAMGGQGGEVLEIFPGWDVEWLAR